MAKINMSFDTETKELSVEANGTTIPDVTNISFYKFKDYDGDWEMRISIVSERELDNGLKQCDNLYASNKEGRTSSKKFPGLFEKINNSTIAKAISALLKNK